MSHRRLPLTGLALAVAVALGACVWRGQPVMVEPNSQGGATTQVGVQRGWLTKEVVEKKEPETLLARDGTACRVSADRFADTRVGAQVSCHWQ